MRNKFANAYMTGQKEYFRLQQFTDDGNNDADEGSGDGDSRESGEEDSGSEGSDNGEGTKIHTDADANAIIERKMAECSKKKDKEISEAKAEAEKLAKMNAEQKRQYPRK